MKSFIHKGDLSEQLDDVARDVLARERANIKQSRFSKFADSLKQPLGLNKNFTQHFPGLINTFEVFSKEIVMKNLESTWQEIESAYDERSQQEQKGLFSDLLKHYSYMNPRKHFLDYLEYCQTEFFDALDLEHIDNISVGDLDTYLSKKVEGHKADGIVLFQQNYDAELENQHFWLFVNMNNIVLPYNQGDELDTNLGTGVCYNNCLFRLAEHIRDPKMERAIPMGSNEKTRVFQATVKHQVHQAKQGEMSWDKASQAIQDSCKKYGLKSVGDPVRIASDPDVYKNLAKKIKQFCKGGFSQVILGLRHPRTGEGHAVNHAIYMIEDDNLGRVKFSTLKEMQTEAKEYFALSNTP